LFAFVPGTAEETYKNRFSVIVRTSVVLPVTFINFTGYTKEQTVQLDWHASEKDVQYYNVMRSSDGKTFQTINKVNSNGEGNHDYKFIDQRPSQKNFYRIDAVDKTGKIISTSVLKIDFAKQAGKISTYPNPASDYVNVALSDMRVGNKINIRLMNVAGLVILEDQFISTSVSMVRQLKLNSIKCGKYLIQVYDGLSTNTHTIEIIK
jgi:hypothetical protein